MIRGQLNDGRLAAEGHLGICHEVKGLDGMYFRSRVEDDRVSKEKRLDTRRVCRVVSLMPVTAVPSLYAMDCMPVAVKVSVVHLASHVHHDVGTVPVPSLDGKSPDHLLGTAGLTSRRSAGYHPSSGGGGVLIKYLMGRGIVVSWVTVAWLTGRKDHPSSAPSCYLLLGDDLMGCRVV